MGSNAVGSNAVGSNAVEELARSDLLDIFGLRQEEVDAVMMKIMIDSDTDSIFRWIVRSVSDGCAQSH